MGYREVKVYDGPFPTYEQIVSGDPTAPPHPKEVWLQQVQPGEFAVRYKDFKTGLPRSPEGASVRASEVCRIFGSLEEARENSRQVAQQHWATRCFIYAHTGVEVDSIFNSRQVNKFAAAMYLGILLQLAVYTLAGMASVWLVYRGAIAALPANHRPALSFNWMNSILFVAAGMTTGILIWFLRLRFVAARHVKKNLKKIESAISAEERKKFEELNTLFGTTDPAERQRFLDLMAEYQQRLREALKK